MVKKALIVDDDSSIRLALTIRLRAAGYDTSSAKDGFLAIEAIKQRRPDVILLDIRMPGIDGFEVNRRLKAAPEFSDIPVIFLSAHTNDAMRQQASETGGAHFFSKPYDAAKLIAAIEAVTIQAGCAVGS